MSEPTQGIFPGMPYPEYAAIPALNWSRLEPYLRSAAHGRAAEADPEDTEALMLGNAIHRAILEPGLFDREYGAVPEGAPARRSAADKLWWENFRAENAGRTMLDPDDLETVRRCQASAVAHPRFASMLASPRSKREVVAVAMDPQSGMWTKCRMDIVGPDGADTTIVDLKSAVDASPWKFSKAMDDHGYAGQLAFYRRIANAVFPYPRKCALFAIEKKAPSVAVWYEVAEEALDYGEAMVDRAITTFTNAVASKSWPGYPDGLLTLPAYRLKR